MSTADRCACGGYGCHRCDWNPFPIRNPAPDDGEAATIAERWRDEVGHSAKGNAIDMIEPAAREAYAAGRLAAFREAAGAVANVDVLNRDQLSVREKCADAIDARAKEGAK